MTSETPRGIRGVADRVSEQLGRLAAGRAAGSDIPPALVDGPYELVDTHFGSLWMLEEDEVIRPYVKERGYWERETVELLTNLVRPGSSFLDIGAGVGYFSLAVGLTVGDVRIDAVEADPVRSSLLRANAWHSELALSSWNVALGSSRGYRAVDPARGDSATAKVVDGPTRSNPNVISPVVTGDQLFAGRSFDVIRLSAGGRETDVLAGMIGTLRASSKVIVVTDYRPAAIRAVQDDPAEIPGRFERMGFSIAVHDPSGLGACEPRDVVAHCSSAGTNGHVRLVLTRTS